MILTPFVHRSVLVAHSAGCTCPLYDLLMPISKVLLEGAFTMSELVKFFPPKQDLAGAGKFMMAGGGLGLFGWVLCFHDPIAGTVMGTLGTAIFLLMFAVSVGGWRAPVLWVTAEGIFFPLGRGVKRTFRWGDPATVEIDPVKRDVMLFGRADNSGATYFSGGAEQTACRIPAFVLTDPAFRLALVRWAPHAYPLFAYLPGAGS